MAVTVTSAVIRVRRAGRKDAARRDTQAVSSLGKRRRNRQLHLRVASVNRRLAASLIDAITALLGVGAGVTLGALLLAKTPLLRRLSGTRIAQAAKRRGGSIQDIGPSKRFSRSLAGLFFLLGVLTRNWRSPSARMLGLRRVDARTGGPVTVRSAIIREAVRTSWNVLGNRLFAPTHNRTAERRKAIQPELKRLHEQHRDDPEALNEAMMRLYQQHNINPFASCVWVLPRMAFSLAQELPAIWSPRHQGLADQVAGTVVIVED